VLCKFKQIQRNDMRQTCEKVLNGLINVSVCLFKGGFFLFPVYFDWFYSSNQVLFFTFMHSIGTGLYIFPILQFSWVRLNM